MADEEALLKKKLESTTDFEERREIRQQLRELRKKKLDALQSDTTANERPRRRDRVKREEQSTVITETKTTAIRDSNSSQPAQTTIEVNYSRTVVTDEPSENGIENGHVESVKSVEEETVSVEDETPVEELPVEVEIGTQFTVQINGAKGLQDSEEEQGTSAPQEISTETESVVETSETATDGKEEETDDKEEEMEEVELTPEVIEKIEDVDQLEKLLKEVPLNEYALRKAIRLQIRQLKVKQAIQKTSRPASKFKSEAPAPKGMRNERFSVDIQDKNELQKLRAQLIQEKETKEKTTPGGKSMTKTVKSEGDGTKEVTTTTEKTTEVEETDAGPAEVTTEVKKTTEVHKAGGATMTVTKTSRTTEVRQTGGSKGMSIDALFAQKKKDRMMAKKQLQTDVKNKRMAFKQQLEAQSPKVEGGGRNFTSGNTAINQLQEWCRRRTKYHEGVDIQNFTTSWANGLAMCALLNYFLPEKIPYETLDPNNKRGNWGLAFKVAGEEGIEPLLELEDVMSVEVPEPKSLITYVHFIYQHFAEKQQQQKNA